MAPLLHQAGREARVLTSATCSPEKERQAGNWAVGKLVTWQILNNYGLTDACGEHKLGFYGALFKLTEQNHNYKYFFPHPYMRRLLSKQKTLPAFPFALTAPTHRRKTSHIVTSRMIGCCLSFLGLKGKSHRSLPCELCLQPSGYCPQDHTTETLHVT